jgi:hypothetical protein
VVVRERERKSKSGKRKAKSGKNQGFRGLGVRDGGDLVDFGFLMFD